MVFTYKIHQPGMPGVRQNDGTTGVRQNSWKRRPFGASSPKHWLNTHAPILRVILRDDTNWTTTSNKSQQYDYCDIDKLSRLKNTLLITAPIASKSFLARLFQDRTDVYPITWIINSRRSVLETSNTALRIYQKNLSGKYFLKPERGYAGQGIILVARPQDALKHIKPGETYILQKTVPDLLLYENKRKFEFRVWVLFVYNRTGTINTYLYQDSVMRLSTVPYDPNSLKAAGNITTSAIYYKDTDSYKSDLLSRQDYYAEVFPKALNISREVISKLKPYLKARPAPAPAPNSVDALRASGASPNSVDALRASGASPNSRGFEFMGFDYLIRRRTSNESDESLICSVTLDPILIEINRNIGYYTYPKNVHAPWVTQENMQMMRDFAKYIMPALLQDAELPRNPGNWKLE